MLLKKLTRKNLEPVDLAARLRTLWLSRFYRCYPRRTSTRQFTIDGLVFQINDFNTSCAPEIIFRELRRDCYGLSRLAFQPGDQVLDIGAHIGFFAIFLAKKYPQVQIYAFEAAPDNFVHLEQNLALNHITNVKIFHQAVSQQHTSLELAIPPSNTGGASAHLRNMHPADYRSCRIPAVSLEAIFAREGIVRCKLLKIDCEGSEYDILMHTSVLDKIEYLAGEFHFNQHLQDQGYTVEGLVEHCSRFIPPEKLHYSVCKMAE